LHDQTDHHKKYNEIKQIMIDYGGRRKKAA